MKLSDFDFELPEKLIAVRPARPRTSAKLLVAQGEQIRDLAVRDLVDVLQAGDHLVLNDTKVIPARLFGERHRETRDGAGVAKIEVTLLEPQADGTWAALVKPMRKLREGEVIVFSPDLSAVYVGRGEDTAFLEFNLTGDDFDAALNDAGAMPLPPYIAAKRPADAQDKDDYQTIWAAQTGAVAAPTASLHFEQWLLDDLAAKGVKFSHVTLHVGAGTFLPVKVDDVSDHKMHSEWGQVSAKAAADILATKAAGGRVIPVGTTACRLIESAGRSGVLQAWEGDTDIFITPGFEFQITDGLMTNFHLPKSTLMMLVSALMGTQAIKDIYAHAIENDYRFFSYGDSSILLP
ncbi:tRNA preQ1(34) S-adenosylmethionine ribosyltransferase-isomerase QueA [Octadecabacter sp. 1_MG-2023]|uniref:tRNA preQ1(34) S-adenosylmethionine ribosyltransferase-isomerase QueA n=1 Tax=unclassified Octadecabacter TaxID=196158 RepID=UPI001C090598|nr:MULTISPECIES: tRNA preQ1(34) S-adenosylmethionine ribosyltransferase-isomerase QueA [unclassified Octadecabacter]MBU2993492.1 tRNA preQ1(34) S-adenosylmethionine ribosyltransferase-isomerase QueA [Octadecabacter sp. B2R22]MDO6733052.1 tRNA preQ1(34) S-adenosylmethionine ribosyltransferase-isomerase QueA [Octadecabacter sp. 1_MG-2023]